MAKLSPTIISVLLLGGCQTHSPTSALPKPLKGDQRPFESCKAEEELFFSSTSADDRSVAMYRLRGCTLTLNAKKYVNALFREEDEGIRIHTLPATIRFIPGAEKELYKYTFHTNSAIRYLAIRAMPAGKILDYTHLEKDPDENIRRNLAWQYSFFAPEKVIPMLKAEVDPETRLLMERHTKLRKIPTRPTVKELLSRVTTQSD